MIVHQMATRENRDIYTVLSQLRAQVDTYVPGKTKITLLERHHEDDYFYNHQEINSQHSTKKQGLHTLVSNNILNSTTSSGSKYHCYHMFCKAITIYRNNNYPNLVLSSSIFKRIWNKLVANGYKPQFQEAAKLFNAGRRKDIFPAIDYSIYLRELKLIK